MTQQSILLFEYYLLAAEVFARGFVQVAKDKATGASSMGHTDTWHDEVFKLELVQKTIEATRYDQLRSRLLSPQVIWPEHVVPSEMANIGATVTTKEESHPEEKYLLTGDTAVPEYGLITVGSPLGRSLVGNSKGSTTDVRMPASSMKVQVLDVSYDVSSMLTRYLRHLFDQAIQELQEIRGSQLFQTFTELAKRVHGGSGGADAERDYYELMASLMSRTAMLEAVLLVIEAYQLSTPIEGKCREILDVFRLLLEQDRIPFESLTAVDYCHPKRV